MFNPNHLHYTEARTREMRKLAEQRRLANTATRRDTLTNTWTHRLLAAVGQQMVASGRFLMAKGEANVRATAEWEQIRQVAS
jgi:hypothetical protein